MVGAVTTNSVLAFAVLAAVLTVLPGSDFALTLRWALRGGPGHAFAAALGIATGSLCWATGWSGKPRTLLCPGNRGRDTPLAAGPNWPRCTVPWLGAGRPMVPAARATADHLPTPTTSYKEPTCTRPLAASPPPPCWPPPCCWPPAAATSVPPAAAVRPPPPPRQAAPPPRAASRRGRRRRSPVPPTAPSARPARSARGSRASPPRVR